MLKAYDEQLRTDAETPGAVSVTRHGPLRLITFDGGRGFISYQDLGGADATGIEALVAAAVAHFEAAPAIEEVEWKTRGHDVALRGCTRPCSGMASCRRIPSRS